MLHKCAVLKLARNALHGLKIYNISSFTAFNRYVRHLTRFISSYFIWNRKLRSILFQLYCSKFNFYMKFRVYDVFLSIFFFFLWIFFGTLEINETVTSHLRWKNTTKTEWRRIHSKAKHSLNALIGTAWLCGHHWPHSTTWTVNRLFWFVYLWNKLTKQISYVIREKNCCFWTARYRFLHLIE